MFYNGGMTLGYLTPAVKTDSNKEKSFKFLSIFTKKPSQQEVALDQETEQDLARAFITPWHLFY